MNLNKTFGIVALASALLISILVPILLNYVGALGFYHNADLAIYIVDKILVSGFLIFLGVTMIMGKWNYYVSIKGLSLTLMIQLLPLFNRIFGLLSGIESLRKWIWAINILISVIIVILYVLFMFVLKMTSNRHEEVYERVKSEEIPVVKTTSYLDESGDLKGPGQ